MSKEHDLPKSFGYAWDGLREAVKREPNLKIHMSAGTIAVLGGVLLGFNRYEWLVLLLTIGMVIILELINSAIETVVDIASPDYSLKAKYAKDIAAGAVLIAAALSIVVGLSLYLPKVGGLF